MAAGSARGAALVDVLAALALAALVSATTLPVVPDTLQAHRARSGALYLAARLHQAQLEALRRARYVAVAFHPSDTDTWFQAHMDGNGNGVLARDIEEGTDPPIWPPDRVGTHAADVTLRVNQRVPDPGGSGWVEAGSDPVRIGRSTLVSFSPVGSATAGTLYLAASRGPQFIVRITGPTARLRLLRFHAGAGEWLP